MPRFIEYRCQERAVDRRHGQIRAHPLAVKNFRHAGKRPEAQDRRGGENGISPLQPAQNGRQKGEDSESVPREHQAFRKLLPVPVREPPLQQLQPRRIIPEFRRRIGIAGREAVQPVQRLHVRGPEIQIVPPHGHAAAHQKRRSHHGCCRRGRGNMPQGPGRGRNERPPLPAARQEKPAQPEKQKGGADSVDPGKPVPKGQPVEREHQQADAHGQDVRQLLFKSDAQTQDQQAERRDIDYHYHQIDLPGFTFTGIPSHACSHYALFRT